jgi:hypothetical protein
MQHLGPDLQERPSVLLPSKPQFSCPSHVILDLCKCSSGQSLLSFVIFLRYDGCRTTSTTCVSTNPAMSCKASNFATATPILPSDKERDVLRAAGGCFRCKRTPYLGWTARTAPIQRSTSEAMVSLQYYLDPNSLLVWRNWLL